ncbi:MAG: 50S ribosomal protein L6 [Deltaproteobacteria bacterium]|nr:50S ribosomal protein L6 [Deltaproteobacteria bacterium]MBN2686959.1 50S ribosomal protein L6 [Deltaproteobacteria bacterium]
MSRIGKKSIEIPSGVNVAVSESQVVVEGPKGKLSQDIPREVAVEIDGNMIAVRRVAENKRGRSFHGLVRTLIDNMVTGVSAGFTKGLEISGVGYRAELVDDKILKLFVGYSKPVEYMIPDGISVKIEKQVNMVVSGMDKEFVGRVAAQIRGIKKPEPYKGKGIRYAGEKIRRKVGKSAGK